MKIYSEVVKKLNQWNSKNIPNETINFYTKPRRKKFLVLLKKLNISIFNLINVM